MPCLASLRDRQRGDDSDARGARARRPALEKAGRRWYEVEADFEAPILFTYFNRTGARFVRNRARAVPLNTWLAITPNAAVDATELFELLTGAETAERLQDDCRVYGNGLWKLEPSELSGLELPRSPARI
jgi:hypothetical protein